VAQNNLADMEDTSSIRLKEALHVLFDFMNGLTAIRGEFARTFVVVTCIESSWKVLKNRGLQAFQDRFEEVEHLDLIRDPGTPQDLIAGRLEEAYVQANFTPPYPTWPFARGFFKSLPHGLTPRQILNRCDSHRLACVRAGKVIELDGYGSISVKSEDAGAVFDKRFEEQRALVDPNELLDPNNEDALGRLMGEAARLFCREVPSDPNIDLVVETDFHETRQYESLHFRMRRIFRLEGDREEHICVRILGKTQYRSFQVRLTAALTTSGMSEKLDGRRLFLIRNGGLPSGEKTL